MHCLLVSVVAVNSCPSHGLCNDNFSTFLCFLLVISWDQMAPSCRDGIFPGVLSRENAERCLREHVCHMSFVGGMSYGAVGHEVSVNE